MRIVVTSDLHLDHVSVGVSRFEEIARAVDATVDRAIEIGAEAWFNLGDLCDPDSGPVVFRCVEHAMRVALRLKAARITSIWIKGNHDEFADGSGDSTLSPLRALVQGAEEYPHISRFGVVGNPQPGAIVVVEHPMVFELIPRGDEIGPIVFALPYGAYDPDAWLRKSLGEWKTTRAIVAGHLTEISGVRLGEETYEMPRGRGISFPEEAARHPSVVARLNGHFHRAQTTPGGVVIPGSLARLTFAEERNDPGFLVLDV